MAWVLRGLRDGVVTTRYPRRRDGYGPGFRGTVQVVRKPVATTDGTPMAVDELVDLCPTEAIGRGPGDDLHVDQGRCILCARCAASRPDLFVFSPSIETSSLTRSGLVVPRVPEDEVALDRVREDLGRRVKALRRSIHIRHVDAGSDGSEEWEVAALTNPVYDVQRLGIYLTATPRHADVLLVTGAGTVGMAGPLRATFDAIPDPKIVVAAGTDPSSGGLFRHSYATSSGIGEIVPVDVWVPGSPPSPFSLLHGILLGIGLLSTQEPVA